MPVVFAPSPTYHAAHWSGLEQHDVWVVCPKCKSENARYIADDLDVTLSCRCGYCKVVATKRGDILTEHLDFGDDVRLPQRGSRLWNCLAMLAGMGRASSGDVCNGLNFASEDKKQTPSEVSSQLTILRYKGLVDVVEKNKGVAGGSTWELTLAAKRFFGGS